MGVEVYRVRGVTRHDKVGDLVLSVDDNGHTQSRFEAWTEFKPDLERHRLVSWRGHFSIREGHQYRHPEDGDLTQWFYTWYSEWGWVRRDDPRVLAMPEWERQSAL